MHESCKYPFEKPLTRLDTEGNTAKDGMKSPSWSTHPGSPMKTKLTLSIVRSPLIAGTQSPDEPSRKRIARRVGFATITVFPVDAYGGQRSFGPFQTPFLGGSGCYPSQRYMRRKTVDRKL